MPPELPMLLEHRLKVTRWLSGSLVVGRRAALAGVLMTGSCPEPPGAAAQPAVLQNIAGQLVMDIGKQVYVG